MKQGFFTPGPCRLLHSNSKFISLVHILNFGCLETSKIKRARVGPKFLYFDFI
jgi:hypothetical protein